MTLDQKIGLLTGIGTLCAVIVALFAIRYSNKNAEKQILIGKLEELYEAVQVLGSYYELFKYLYGKILIYRNDNQKEIETLEQYKNIRNQNISDREKEQIISYISKVEILSMCYTKKSLQKDAKQYFQLMLSFFDLVYNGGSIQASLYFKEGFPGYIDFYKQMEDLKKSIVAEIKTL